MRRPVLVSTLCFGLAMSLGAFAGVFAVFTDEASTGPNSVGTATLPNAADIKLATGATDQECKDYFDDLQTGFYSFSDVTPSEELVFASSNCVKNFGPTPVAVTLRAVDVTDTELGPCTGDEQAAGDATCGEGAAGEISPLLELRFSKFPCTGSLGSVHQATLTDLQTTPAVIGSIAPGQCLRVSSSFVYNPSVSDAHVAQSDLVTFRLVFTGTSV